MLLDVGGTLAAIGIAALGFVVVVTVCVVVLRLLTVVLPPAGTADRPQPDDEPASAAPGPEQAAEPVDDPLTGGAPSEPR